MTKCPQIEFFHAQMVGTILTGPHSCVFILDRGRLTRPIPYADTLISIRGGWKHSICLFWSKGNVSLWWWRLEATCICWWVSFRLRLTQPPRCCETGRAPLLQCRMTPQREACNRLHQWEDEWCRCFHICSQINARSGVLERSHSRVALDPVRWFPRSYSPPPIYLRPLKEAPPTRAERLGHQPRQAAGNLGSGEVIMVEALDGGDDEGPSHLPVICRISHLQPRGAPLCSWRFAQPREFLLTENDIPHGGIQRSRGKKIRPFGAKGGEKNQTLTAALVVESPTGPVKTAAPRLNERHPSVSSFGNILKSWQRGAVQDFWRFPPFLDIPVLLVSNITELRRHRGGRSTHPTPRNGPNLNDRRRSGPFCLSFSFSNCPPLSLSCPLRFSSRTDRANCAHCACALHPPSLLAPDRNITARGGVNFWLTPRCCFHGKLYRYELWRLQH